MTEIWLALLQLFAVILCWITALLVLFGAWKNYRITN